ncbi:LysR family transcriptional regulator [Pseudomonas sp. RIT-PI-q]|uniref:LysR family transcriptional regulator n=1 Tax=Pseudomonas sp. RIT-PI-q TaxID=1690247 RepID=UPI0006CDB261|nr:LysR family transcriptional regulator [Pseudomonas sp. RIT-PI-q]KPG95457.1 LysR family transcriptional regulator [Pseudomonas sp. RIT-PI-q]
MLFEDLKAFVAVIECASLTKAAEVLCITQSAVSRRIQHLEESLNVSLFDRTSRPPVPTAMGHRIYASAVGLLRDAHYLLSIPQEDALPSGRFRVGFTQMVADAVAFDVVTRMREKFPDLEMQLITDWSSELEHLILHGALDAATLMLPAPSNLPDGLKGQRVTTLEILVVQSKEKPVVGSHSDIKSLSGKEWILNPKGCGYRAALEAAMGGQGQKLKLGVDTHSAAMQMRMVVAGLGLGLIPVQLLQSSPSADQLSIVEINDFSLKMDIWIVQSTQPGNLRQAYDLLIDRVLDGLRVPVGDA